MRQPGISGNLTDDFEYARKWALRRARQANDTASILEFHFAQNDLVELGIIEGYEVLGFATRLKVKASVVPREYFTASHLDPLIFEALDPEQTYLYRAPRENVVQVHSV